MSKLIPNAFQVPNEIVDLVWTFLSSPERDVLIFAIREILGWQDSITERQAHISMRVFVEGKIVGGRHVSYGCGLSRAALRQALDGLARARLLIPVGEPTQDGQCYWLQDDTDNLDWEWLRRRKADAARVNAERIAPARQARSVGQEGGCSVAQNDRCSMGQNGSVLSDRTGGVLSDRNKESHIENQLENQDRGANAPRKPQGVQPKLLRLDPEQTTAFSNDLDFVLRDALIEQARADPQRRAPRKFETMAQKLRWRKAAQTIVEIGKRQELDRALQYAFEQGRSSRGAVINTVVVWAKNLVDPPQSNGKRAPKVMDHDAYVAWAARNPTPEVPPDSFGEDEIPFR